MAEADIQDDGDFLQLLRDERDITRVIQMYCRGSDRKDFELMRQAYHDDAFDDHGPFKGNMEQYMAWARQNHERFDEMMHQAGPPLIEIRGHVAIAETYCTLVQQLRPAGDLVPGARVTMGCRYVDKFEKRAGAWKIAHRVVAYEWIRKEWVSFEHAPHPPGSDFTWAQRSKDDPVYTLWDMAKPVAG